MNDARVKAFEKEYARVLTAAIIKHPELFDLPEDHTPEEHSVIIASKTVKTMVEKGPLSVFRHAPEFLAACKAVGVKNTNTELKRWFEL